MPISNNIDAVVSYDNDSPIRSPRILASTEPAGKEHACQCIAIETLRELMASGITVQGYNNLDETAWQAVIESGRVRATMNVAAPVPQASAYEVGAAGSYGGNYFETGYENVIAAVQQADTVVFTRTGGLQ